MRILITGGAGFIGSHLAEYYQARARVRVLDSLRSGHRHNLAGLDVEFIEGDIRDRKLVREAVQSIDVVFHLAAMVSVAESFATPVECNAINTVGLLHVLEEASSAGVSKLVFSSSAAIYGNDPVVPTREEMSPRPKSPYAITKLDGEYYCQLFHNEGRLMTACLRYFNVFGPRQDPASAYAAAVPIFVANALANKPITIFGDGEQTRDFVFVKEVVTANAHLAEQPDLAGVYNVGYGKSITINQLAERIIELTGSHSWIQHQPTRPGDVKHSRAAIDKLLASGFKQNCNFDIGLDRIVHYIRQAGEAIGAYETQS